VGDHEGSLTNAISSTYVLVCVGPDEEIEALRLAHRWRHECETHNCWLFMRIVVLVRIRPLPRFTISIILPLPLVVPAPYFPSIFLFSMLPSPTGGSRGWWPANPSSVDSLRQHYNCA
jgi:hypothetical protein